MAENTKGIGTTGGFFNSKGVLKTKKELATEEKNAKKASLEVNNQAAVSDLSSSSNVATRAAREVSNRTFQNVNKALGQNAETKSDLDAARKSVKSEIENLKALKENLSGGTPEEIEALRKKQGEAEKNRAEVAADIEKNNGERTLEGQTSIKVGSQTLRNFTPQKVSFSAGEKTDLSSAESIDKAIQGRQEDLKKLKDQGDENKSQRKAIAETAGKAIEKIRETLGDSAVTNDSEAAKLSQEIASAIKQSGASSVDAFNPKNINQQIVASLST